MRINKIWQGICLTLTVCALHLSAMTTNGNQIIDSQGNPVALKGVNWYGFNNGQTMVEGLYSDTTLSSDFATVVYRLQLLGFNAIRLPFSFQDLYNLPPINWSKNCTLASQAQIQASVTDPSNPPITGAAIPPMISPPLRTAGKCDDYFPNTTTLSRFLWTVNFFAKNGFYVLIDDHAEDQTVVTNKSDWVKKWTDLVTLISQDPISKDKLMIDILNEPDNFGIQWEASNGLPALKDLYISVMDAIYPINPNALFFIEGTGQGGIGANWGDGFATDPTLISQNGLSDPNPFFKALMQKPYLNQVVISPHVYPPTITGATTDYTGTGLWNRLNESFGYLTQKGYCLNNTCKVFPVAIGEFGSRFQDKRDLASMPDIASYLNNANGAKDGVHQAIPSWFYWSWNPTSSDTGGLVNDDYQTIIWQKIEYLLGLGLTPWYLNHNPTPPPPSPTPPPPAPPAPTPPPVPINTGTLCIKIANVSGLSASALLPIIVDGVTFNIAKYSQAVCQSLNAGTYQITPPKIVTAGVEYDAPSQNVTINANKSTAVTITYKAVTPPPAPPAPTPPPAPAPPPAPTPPPPANSTITVTVSFGTPWKVGKLYNSDLNLTFQNLGSLDIAAPWKITVSNASYNGVVDSWSVINATVKGGVFQATANESWETLLALGKNTVTVGAVLSSSTANFTPTSVKVNGVECKIIK